MEAPKTPVAFIRWSAHYNKYCQFVSKQESLSRFDFSQAALFTAKRDCGQKCPSKVCKYREYKCLQSALYTFDNPDSISLQIKYQHP